MIQCAFHRSCQHDAEYGCIDWDESMESIDKLYCLHHVMLFLAGLDPGESKVVYRFMEGHTDRELHVVTT
jgi:hypothetical protein